MASWDGTVVTSELKLKTRWSLIQAKKNKVCMEKCFDDTRKRLCVINNDIVFQG